MWHFRGIYTYILYLISLFTYITILGGLFAASLAKYSNSTVNSGNNTVGIAPVYRKNSSDTSANGYTHARARLFEFEKFMFRALRALIRPAVSRGWTGYRSGNRSGPVSGRAVTRSGRGDRKREWTHARTVADGRTDGRKPDSPGIYSVRKILFVTHIINKQTSLIHAIQILKILHRITHLVLQYLYTKFKYAI